MSILELVENFIDHYNKPFSAETLAVMIQKKPDEIVPILDSLLADKRIRLISQTELIYARANRYQAQIGYQHYKGWTFDQGAAHQLLDVLEQGKYKSIRDIALAVGRSRQWVYIYLEALASIEVIDLRSYVYVVISRKNVPKIGRKVNKGILSMLRNLNKVHAHRIIT
ncbi:MAG: hypothetical protein PHQ41_02250 [Candidatus Cloacimonetes bacterium]|jgi:hypothetical protein|nr:hypothetical protein [Candidatus Cloacimonadota bacterium]